MPCCLGAVVITAPSPPAKLRDLAARRTRALHKHSPPREGAGNAGCALHPRSRVQYAQGKRTRAYRFSGNTPASPTQWLYGLCHALPGDEFLLSPSSAASAAARPGWVRVSHRRLGTSNGCQNHMVLPYATTRLRQPPSSELGLRRVKRLNRALTSFVLHALESLTRFNPPCDRNCAPTLSRPPHPAPRS